MRKTWIDKAAEEVRAKSSPNWPQGDKDAIRDIIAKHHEAITKPEPGHIWDWAAACGAYLHAEGVQLSSHRIAAVVAHFAESLVDVVMHAKRQHYHDVRPVEYEMRYCCPLCPCGEHVRTGPCTCGADAWNAKVDAALSAREV